MARCDVCGKGTAFGRNIRHKHSGRWERKAPRTNRTFKANVQNKTFVIDGHVAAAEDLHALPAHAATKNSA